MLITSPLEQFALTTLIPLNLLGWNISITNATLFLVLTFSLLYLFLTIAMKDATVIPNNWQYVVESLYTFVNENLVRDLIQNNKGREYFPLFLYYSHSYL
jgi:F-type H+-transporting ATPase subunit a